MALTIKQSKTNFVAGVGTVDATAARLTLATSFRGLKGVYIKCTAGTIYVGNSSGVSAANGYPLVAAGDNAVEIAIDNPNKIWVIGDAPARTYKWLAS